MNNVGTIIFTKLANLMTTEQMLVNDLRTILLCGMSYLLLNSRYLSPNCLYGLLHKSSNNTLKISDTFIYQQLYEKEVSIFLEEPIYEFRMILTINRVFA